MKNFLKILGIIALVAVIGFGMVACSDDGDGGKDGGKDGSDADAAALAGNWYKDLDDFDYVLKFKDGTVYGLAGNSMQYAKYSATKTVITISAAPKTFIGLELDIAGTMAYTLDGDTLTFGECKGSEEIAEFTDVVLVKGE